MSDLYHQAKAVMSDVSGGGKWDLWNDGPAKEDTSTEEWGLFDRPRKEITRWKQAFKGTVDFE